MQNCTRPNRPDLDATKVPTELDIAWSAGIYEGEGTCRMCGKGKRGFMASVTQKDPELLYRLREWFGGSVRDNGTGQGIHTWDICGDRARVWIASIYGFMTSRRKMQIDATTVLEFLDGRAPIGLNTAQIRSALDEFYAKHRAAVSERRRKAANERGKRWYRENHLTRELKLRIRDQVRDQVRADHDRKTQEGQIALISKSA